MPGISNSGPGHWQTLWEARHPAVFRLQQRDWDRPDCDEWASALDEATRRIGEVPILVAHSLGCLVAARWAALAHRAVHGILLVAVPDPAGPNFPKEASGFSSVPDTLRGKRATVVSSSDDPYSSADFVERCVRLWGAEHVQLGPLGHINAESGLGDWPGGWAIVEAWRNAADA